MACQKGAPVSFVTAASLVHELIEARDETRLLRLQRQLARVKLLIVDELGFVPLSKTGAELPFEEWTETFGSEHLTGTLLDRLAHHVNILEMNGESYRLGQSRKADKKHLFKMAPTGAMRPATRLLCEGHTIQGARLKSTVAHHLNWPIFTPPLAVSQSKTASLKARSPCRAMISPMTSSAFSNPRFQRWGISQRCTPKSWFCTCSQAALPKLALTKSTRSRAKTAKRLWSATCKTALARHGSCSTLRGLSNRCRDRWRRRTFTRWRC